MVTHTTKDGTGTIGVLELGTNSLKLHLAKDPPEHLEQHRLEWDVGFEVYSSRRISEETIEGIISQVHALFHEHGVDPGKVPISGIATGAFRDAENTSALFDRLSSNEGIPVRALTVEEEASLLIDGSSGLVPERPGMAFDLGGDSLEVVYFGRDGSWLRECLPLGVIRLHHMAMLASGKWDEEPLLRWIDKSLQRARSFRLPSVHGTGGTVKAIAQVAKRSPISIEDLRNLEREVRTSGAPEILSRRRRDLFLPGLIVTIRLVEHFGARSLHYTRVDLGEVLLARLRPFRSALQGPACRSSFLQHIDLFRADWPSGSPAAPSGGRDRRGENEPALASQKDIG